MVDQHRNLNRQYLCKETKLITQLLGGILCFQLLKKKTRYKQLNLNRRENFKKILSKDKSAYRRHSLLKRNKTESIKSLVKTKRSMK